MSSNESEKVNFRKLLLLKCQKEFEKDKGEDIRKAEQRKKIEEATTVSVHPVHFSPSVCPLPEVGAFFCVDVADKKQKRWCRACKYYSC